MDRDHKPSFFSIVKNQNQEMFHLQCLKYLGHIVPPYKQKKNMPKNYKAVSEAEVREFQAKMGKNTAIACYCCESPILTEDGQFIPRS